MSHRPHYRNMLLLGKVVMVMVVDLRWMHLGVEIVGRTDPFIFDMNIAGGVNGHWRYMSAEGLNGWTTEIVIMYKYDNIETASNVPYTVNE